MFSNFIYLFCFLLSKVFCNKTGPMQMEAESNSRAYTNQASSAAPNCTSLPSDHTGLLAQRDGKLNKKSDVTDCCYKMTAGMTMEFVYTYKSSTRYQGWCKFLRMRKTFAGGPTIVLINHSLLKKIYNENDIFYIGTGQVNSKMDSYVDYRVGPELITGIAAGGRGS